jgi:hypothetical protein
MPNPKFQNKQILLFIIILFIAAVSRLFYLDKGYNSDESWLLRRASLNLSNLIPILDKGRSVYPPLPQILLHFWLKLFKSEIWVRGYFVVFGVALSILIYFLGKFYIGGTFSLLVFSLSAISPLLIWSSQFVRSYIDSAFWVTLSTYFLLKILKTGFSRYNFSGYLFSSALAIYSSYLNIIILVAQNLFVFIFHFKNLKFLIRWFALQFSILVIFTPCLFLLLRQVNLATAIDPKWSQRGFQLFGFNLGYHARSVAATFGMEPGFLTMHPLTQRLSRSVLIFLSVFAFLAMAWIFLAALNNLKGFFKDNRLIWFFPFISISALVLYDCLVEFLNFPLQAEYFLVQHILFLFVIASAIYPVREGPASVRNIAYIKKFSKISNSKISNFAFIIISLIFILRYPEAIKPEFETKKASAYLANNIRDTVCLLMVRNTNQYIDKKSINITTMFNFLHKESDADYYRALDEEAQAVLLGLKKKYKDIWFYRAYGNDEILGANKLIMSWLKNNGYKIGAIQHFRRVDIIQYER